MQSADDGSRFDSGGLLVVLDFLLRLISDRCCMSEIILSDVKHPLVLLLVVLRPRQAAFILSKALGL